MSRDDFKDDPRVVLTLDAGGTNFVFSAVRAAEEAVRPVTLPSHADDLDLCLKTMFDGFGRVMGQLSERPTAISFAFPAPADYPNGIIGPLQNLPAFSEGVPLGPILEEEFRLPVFINNDGDLFAYGEALFGFLPQVNSLLEKAGSPKRYRNLLAVTLGTGFGAGIVRDGELFLGDNSNGAEIWLLRSKLDPGMNVEEGASIRAVRREYALRAGIPFESAPEPRDIYDIALGRKEGDRSAAARAFARMAEVVGDALANALTLIDGLAVIGGGLAGAASVFMPALVAEMNSTYVNYAGQAYGRLVQRVYNLEDEADLREFLKGRTREVVVPGSGRRIIYDPEKRTGVGVTRLGTSQATSLGAYAYALRRLG